MIPATAEAQEVSSERGQVILVLDASGSMWGQIDGTPKITIARNQIAEMLNDWDGGIDLGLIAYGHREKGVCEDIEMIVPPAPVQPEAFTALVETIQPLGKTPLTASVRMAAEAMRYSEEKATVVLLSDGLENCGMDPCALAEELERSGVDFTAHVIGFDVAQADAAQLSCLADKTGGEFFLAGDAKTLTASLQQAARIVAEAAPEPAPEPEPQVLTPEPEPEPAGPVGLRARAKLCETCDILEKDVFWILLSAEAALDGSRTEFARNANADWISQPLPGEYMLRTKVGDAITFVPVTVTADTLADVVVNLQAGTLRLRAEAAPGGTALEDTMFYWINEAEAALDGSRQEVTRSGNTVPIFTLPEGEYQVVARHGDAYKRQMVKVAAGELSDVMLDMNVGYARVSAIPTEGAAPLQDDVFYWVFEAKTDLEGNRKEVSRSGNAETVFRLTAGDYLLRTRHGAAYADQSISLEADTLTNVSVDMNVGYLDVATVMAEGQPALEDDVFYWVNEAKTDLSGNRKEVTRSGDAQPLFKLTAGEYQIVTRHGAAYMTSDVSVTAGTREQVTVVQNSGMLRAEAVLQEGGDALGDGVFWYVLGPEDLSGNRDEITRSGNAMPALFVPAGNFVLRARYEGQTFDFPVSLDPGEVKSVTVLLQN